MRVKSSSVSNLFDIGLTNYKYGTNYLNLRIAFSLLIGTLVYGVGGFMIFEDYNLLDGIYMTVITLSTVGYHEVQPLTDSGKIFATSLIFINLGVFTYSASAFTYFVIQGELFKKFHFKLLKRRINKLENHVIICGFGRYGKEIVSYFLRHQKPFIVIEMDRKHILEIQSMKGEIIYIEDDATKDEVLLSAGIEKASSVITALGDDTENLYVSLTAKQLNPDIKVISRVTEQRSIDKLMLAGSDHVVMPTQIGGFFMANLVNKPHATEFFNFISDEIEHDIDFAQIPYEDMKPEHREKSILELQIREKTGANVIGFRTESGKYVVNPTPDTKLIPDSSFIIIGNASQMDSLRKYLTTS